MVAGGMGSLESCRAGVWGSRLVFVAVSCPVCARIGGTRRIPEPCLGNTPTMAPAFRIFPWEPGAGAGTEAPSPKGGSLKVPASGSWGGFGEEQGGGRLG